MFRVPWPMTALAMSEYEPETSAELSATAQAVVRVDERAFRQLVIEHGPHVRRLVRSLGIGESELDDVCQETFIVVHRRLHTFEGRSALRTWLFGIALRVASDYRSKAYRRREQPTELLPELQHGATAEHALERKQAWSLIESLIAPLSEERRQVFVLYEIAELSMPEIATLLACPLQTAYSRLHAAREHVERAMAALRRKEQGR